MEKRLFLVLALSILIIVTFQYFVAKPSYKAPAQNPIAETTPAASQKLTEMGQGLPSKPSVEEKTLTAETERYILTFSNIGGSIKEIRLKDYKDSLGGPLALVDIKNPREYIFNISSPFCPAPLDLSGYEVERTDQAIKWSLKTNDFEITKRYVLLNYKYAIELQLFIKNISAAPKEFNYEIIGGAGVREPHIQDKRFLEVTSKIGDKIVNFKRPKNERIITPGSVSWSALKTKYFSIILKPFTAKAQFYTENKDNELVMGIDSDPVIIQPGSSIEDKFILYVGPGHIPILKEFGYDLEESVNYGFFGGIAKALISLMRLFYMVLHSWGLSIILLSVFLNIILFPLTIKSFKSMHKMQELHPEMEKLKIKYKDSPQKLNKEIMELYKKYNINPLGGCLPLLLQMPIFIALYQALLRYIELRSAPFLWIKDLSLPDAVPIPISLPIIGNSINILPIAMVAVMVIQQRISTKTMGAAVTEEQKQQQKMMLIIMPVVFGAIFYTMPSGLVLYWVVNTILTIVEQAAFLKKA